MTPTPALANGMGHPARKITRKAKPAPVPTAGEDLQHVRGVLRRMVGMLEEDLTLAAALSDTEQEKARHERLWGAKASLADGLATLAQALVRLAPCEAALLSGQVPETEPDTPPLQPADLAILRHYLERVGGDDQATLP